MPNPHRVIAQFKDTIKAEIPTFRMNREWQSSLYSARRWGGLREYVTDAAEIQITNVLVPTFRLTQNGRFIVDPLDTSAQAPLEEYVQGYAFPPELRFDPRRFNPLVGLLTAAHFSPEVREDVDVWPTAQPLPGKPKPFMMAPPQVPVLALQRREELASAKFAQALAEHVEKNAA